MHIQDADKFSVHMYIHGIANSICSCRTLLKILFTYFISSKNHICFINYERSLVNGNVYRDFCCMRKIATSSKILSNITTILIHILTIGNKN